MTTRDASEALLRAQGPPSYAVGGRVATQRALLREVNDGILAIARGWRLDGCPISFRCECGFGGCADNVSLFEDEYVETVASEHVFIVAPVHLRQVDGDVVGRIARRAVVVRAPSPLVVMASAANERTSARMSGGS